LDDVSTASVSNSSVAAASKARSLSSVDSFERAAFSSGRKNVSRFRSPKEVVVKERRDAIDAASTRSFGEKFSGACVVVNTRYNKYRIVNQVRSAFQAAFRRFYRYNPTPVLPSLVYFKASSARTFRRKNAKNFLFFKKIFSRRAPPFRFPFKRGIPDDRPQRRPFRLFPRRISSIRRRFPKRRR